MTIRFITKTTIQWKNVASLILGIVFILWFIFGSLYIVQLKKAYSGICLQTREAGYTFDASDTIVPLAISVLFQGSWIIGALLAATLTSPVGFANNIFWFILAVYITFSMTGHIFIYVFANYDECSMLVGGFNWLISSTLVWMILAAILILYGIFQVLTRVPFRKIPGFFVKKTVEEIELGGTT